MKEGNLPLVADPVEKMLNYLQAMGYDLDDMTMDEAMHIDYPKGTDAEMLRHYILGAGGPFINFVSYVDVGVGFTLEPQFEDKDQGIEAKEELEEMFDRIDYWGTTFTDCVYYETLGRSCTVLTSNALGTDFFQDEYADVTGIDCINPMSLDPESVLRVMKDTTGTVPFLQRVDEDDKEFIPLSQDRVIFKTRNPFAKRSATGISMLQPALKEMRTVVKFPRFREQIAKKLSNIFRHYVIDHEQLMQTELGRQIFSSRQSEQEYLLAIQNLIMQQEARHSSIASFKWMTSTEKSYGGKEPQLESVENQTLQSMALKLEVPLNVMSFGKEVNRATLDTISDFFVQRRKNGPQKKHKFTIEKICNLAMEKWNYEGTFKAIPNPFIREDENSKWERVGNIYQKNPDAIGETEFRRLLGLPDEIERGPADEQVMEWRKENATIGAPPANALTDPEALNPLAGFPRDATLGEMKGFLRKRGVIIDV